MSVQTRRMSHLDAALFALETPANHMNLGLLAVFEGGKATADEIVQLLRERLGKSARYDDLRLVVAPSRIGFTPPKLVDGGPLDLSYHVQLSALDGDGAPLDVDAWVSNEMSFPLDHSKPLWQMTVLSGFTNGEFGVFLKGHHSVMDGPSALNTALQILDDERLLGSSHVTHGFLRSRGGFISTVLGGVVEYLSYPVRVVRLVLDPTRSALRRNRLSFLPKFFYAPRTLINRAIGGDRAVARVSVPLDDVISLRRDTDTTGLDVVLSFVSTSLRKLLLERDALPDESLIAMVAVPQSGDLWRKASGNRIALEFVSLATDIDDQQERLHRINHAAREASQVTRLRGSNLWERYAGAVPPGVVHFVACTAERFRLGNKVRPFASVIASNLTGPRTGASLGGASLRELWPFGPPRDSVPINVTALSFDGKLHFSVVADKSLAIEAREIANSIPEALAELQGSIDPRVRGSIDLSH